MHIPKTLTEAVRYYQDEQVCIDTVAAMRWLDGKPVCPKCGVAEGERKHYWLAAQKRWKCYSCRKQFSVKVDSIFEDSPLGLDIWLIAMWMLCNCKNGVSSHEISRETGISQKAAWHLLHRIRLVLKGVEEIRMGQTGGPVEADEAFIGPTPNRMHARKRALAKNGAFHINKPAVFGIYDRETRQVRAKLIPNVSRETLQQEILDQVVPGSKVFTDGWKGYEGLNKEFVHQTVNHLTEYVRGEIHTQGIENFWSLLKRGLHGTYVAVEPFHLFRYVDEQMFRFNNRAMKDNPLTNADRFALALSQVAGKRLTWKEVTGKEGGSPEPF